MPFKPLATASGNTAPKFDNFEPGKIYYYKINFNKDVLKTFALLGGMNLLEAFITKLGALGIPIPTPKGTMEIFKAEYLNEKTIMFYFKHS